MKHLYTNTISGKRIAIIGRYPPPLGGISVHVQRVIAKLQTQNNRVFFFEASQRIRFIFFFIYQIKLFLFLGWHKPEIVFYHTLYLKNAIKELKLIIFLKKVFKFQVIVIDHNFRYLQTQSNSFKVVLNVLMSSIDHQIFIGTVTEQNYREYGIVKPKSWSIESAFLQPDLSQEQTILNLYPSSLFQFLHMHKPILIANASHLTLLPDGRDLYGFDICLQVLLQLKPQFPDIGLIFALPKIGDQHYFNRLQTFIRQKQLNDHVYFLLEQKELWPLLKKADLFLRPTVTDSDGISVREAAHFGIPVVASDACVRPPEVLLFKAGDVDDCLKKVLSVLSRYEKTNIRSSYMHTQSPS